MKKESCAMTTRRDFMKAVPAAGAAFAVAGHIALDDSPAFAQSASVPPDGHFHPKGKSPSEHTLKVLAEARETLPFSDTRDFEENARGLIAEMPNKKIMADAGNVAWDMESFDFFNEDKDWPSIHPSLQRISRLNQNYGLYEVIPGIYQVRGFDLSQMTMVRGNTGWIVFDTLISAETARAAWDLFQQHVGEGLPITAVIHSHSHGDHWGGVRGIVDEADVRAGKIEIIVPRDFMEYTISENVYAGNAMNRRLSYQYGQQLPISPFGFAGQGLGHRVSFGEVGLISPTKVIEEDIEYLEVDGIRMVFQNTPNTEAPSEMNTYIPEMRALWMAENVNATLHNIYTLRGAEVRDALIWSKYIAQALYLFGTEADVMFTAHHWPRWGNDRVQEVLRAQRDLYAHMNNQVLHLANQGVTINEIHNVYELPESLEQKWYCRGYHGTARHNSRGVIQKYLGFWDANPATLVPQSPEDSAPLYVEMMGGAAPILAKGKELHDAGKYLMAVEILNKLFLAENDNQEARDLLADCYEQLGYQDENPGLRNCYLAGAYELRSGISDAPVVKGSSPDVIRAMSTELFLNFLGIRMDSRQAEGMKFTMNIITPDNGEKFIVEMENATLTNIEGFLADNPDLTLTINRTDLERTMGGEATLDAQIADGTAKVEGNVEVLAQLASTMVDFDPLFEILPGTATAHEVEQANAYEAVLGAPIAE
jgi:alkyl sulfatase BDS1-like metallo-beta-lactamase superfamily hydrolase